MKTVIISANFGQFDKERPWEWQPADIYRLNDSSMPIRQYAMTARLQSKLVKEFGWQLFPGYEVYIWVDSAFRMLQGATEWLVTNLGEYDMLFFKHPFNATITEEYSFLKNNYYKRYVRIRYTNEFLEEQYMVIKNDESYVDDLLLCGGIIAYRNKPCVHAMLKEWWYHTSRYHMDDQLSLPYVLKNSGCSYKVLSDDIYKLPLIPHERHDGIIRINPGEK